MVFCLPQGFSGFLDYVNFLDGWAFRLQCFVDIYFSSNITDLCHALLGTHSDDICEGSIKCFTMTSVSFLAYGWSNFISSDNKFAFNEYWNSPFFFVWDAVFVFVQESLDALSDQVSQLTASDCQPYTNSSSIYLGIYWKFSSLNSEHAVRHWKGQLTVLSGLDFWLGLVPPIFFCYQKPNFPLIRFIFVRLPASNRTRRATYLVGLTTTPWVTTDELYKFATLSNI